MDWKMGLVETNEMEHDSPWNYSEGICEILRIFLGNGFLKNLACGNQQLNINRENCPKSEKFYIRR